jgi:hypothetical protein
MEPKQITEQTTEGEVLWAADAGRDRAVRRTDVRWRAGCPDLPC